MIIFLYPDFCILRGTCHELTAPRITVSETYSAVTFLYSDLKNYYFLSEIKKDFRPKFIFESKFNFVPKFYFGPKFHFGLIFHTISSNLRHETA